MTSLSCIAFFRGQLARLEAFTARRAAAEDGPSGEADLLACLQHASQRNIVRWHASLAAVPSGQHIALDEKGGSAARTSRMLQGRWRGGKTDDEI